MFASMARALRIEYEGARYHVSDARKLLIAGLLRYHYPVRAQWVGDQLEMGHFTTVSRAMKFYDEPGEVWGREKECILKFIG